MNADYNETIKRLLTLPDLLGELVPRTKGDPKIKTQLDALKLGSDDMSACLRAGLYLRFNFLDESHTVSQGIHSLEGSYWHAIMHRREPDYSNSKYWYRRVPAHPVFDELGKLAIVKEALGKASFDPVTFVDLCEVAENKRARYEAAVELQRAEWRTLFEYCLQHAGNK